MQKNSLIKILVPVVAVVVIFESVMLVSGLINKRNSVERDETASSAKLEVVEESITNDESKQPPEAQVSEANLELSASSSQMVLGSKGEVSAALTTDKQMFLDAVNLYFKYDPAKVLVTGLTFGKGMPKPAFSKISKDKGLVVVNFLVTEPSGLEVPAGKSLELAKFTVEPLVEGSFDIEMSTGKESKESATMLVEAKTARAVPFASEKLTVNVNSGQ